MQDNPTPPYGDIVLYQTEDGRTRVECRFAEETLWLSQAVIAELFQVSLPTVNEHLKNVYDEGELTREPTIRKFRIVRREGAREVARLFSMPCAANRSRQDRSRRRQAKSRSRAQGRR